MLLENARTYFIFIAILYTYGNFCQVSSSDRNTFSFLFELRLIGYTMIIMI